MSNIDSLFDKLYITPRDNTLYLLEKLPCGTGLFASNGNVLYLVLNEECCPSMSIKTEYLNLETNIYVSAFNPSVSTFENGFYNSVELELSDSVESINNFRSFYNLCLSHSTYMNGQDFVNFFDSLVSLFQLPREQQYKNLVGLMGELLFIEYIFNYYGVDLSQFWHTDGSKSRLDFVSPFANLEVKTTTSESMRVLIKHNQLFLNSDMNYLVAVVMDEDNAGRSLDELISVLLNATNYCNSLQFTVNIEKEKRRISPTDLINKRFSLKGICLYRAKDINPFVTIPNYVEKLSYNMELTSLPNKQFSDILPH